MHAVVMESLEEYLSGTLEPADQRKIEAHLGSCEACLEELAGMQEHSQLFGSLRCEEVLEPAPGFFARVMRQAGEREAVPSFWNLFALEMAFRRLVFASLVTLAVLGTYLVSREAGPAGGPSPAAVMAEQNSPAFDSASAQDNMLVTLTAYERF